VRVLGVHDPAGPFAEDGRVCVGTTRPDGSRRSRPREASSPRPSMTNWADRPVAAAVWAMVKSGRATC
jgi:hypothetical protein